MLSRLRAAASGFVQDDASQMGAALAYYTLFSLAPLLVLATLILGTVLSEEETRKQVVAEAETLLNKEGVDVVHSLLHSFQNGYARAAASGLGLASLLFGASGMFSSLRSSLLRIWRLPPRQEGWLVALVKSYLLAFLMVGLACIFSLALLIVSTAMPLIQRRWGELVPMIPWSGGLADLAVSTLLLVVLFLFTYRLLSEGRIAYSQVLPGAFVASLLFTVGKIAIGYYLAHTTLASAYGAAGSMVVFLVWVYYSAQIVFFGAEVIRFGLPHQTAALTTRSPDPTSSTSAATTPP